MAVAHKLKIVFDDATGAVSLSHRCTVTVAGRPVGHDVPIDPPAGIAESLKAFVDANREAVEREATRLAIQHAAAVAGRDAPGVSRLAAGGSLGATGGTAAKGNP